MTGRGLPVVDSRTMATGGVGLLSLTSIMHSAFAYGDPDSLLPYSPSTGLIMGQNGYLNSQPSQGARL